MVKNRLYYLMSFYVMKVSKFTIFSSFYSLCGNFFRKNYYSLSLSIALISSVIISMTSLSMTYLLFLVVSTSENMGVFDIFSCEDLSILSRLVCSICFGRHVVMGFCMELSIYDFDLWWWKLFFLYLRFYWIFLWKIASPMAW